MQKGFSAAHPAGFGMLTWVRWWPWGERGTTREACRCHSGSEGRFWGASTMTGGFSTFYLMTHAGTKNKHAEMRHVWLDRSSSLPLCVWLKSILTSLFYGVFQCWRWHKEKSRRQNERLGWDGSSVSATGSAIQLQNSIVVTFFSDIVIMWTFSFQIK